MKIIFNKQIKYGKKTEQEYDMKMTCQRLYEEQMLDIQKIRMELFQNITSQNITILFKYLTTCMV
jgi:hypothetical protein